MHGEVETPCFMPVATKGSVKTLTSEEVMKTAQAVIVNAFVLSLRPGIRVIKKAGGLHSFMNWEKVIFTDSGGFQMLKEDFLLGVSKKGVTFRSPFDDTRHLLTPEKCVEIQASLGSDVAMVLDDCPPYGKDYNYVKGSLERTIDWAKRSKASHKGEGQLLFSILQGGVFPDLRKKGAEELVKLDFDGYGIGGLSIGEPKKEMLRVLSYTMPLIPEEKPRYLMGVGSPIELLEAISLGVDIFDSAFPTRNARHNTFYTWKGKYNITRGRFSRDLSPLEEGCGCYACENYSRAYISHLMRVYEMLGMRLLTLHNLYFVQELMKRAREAIIEEEFEGFKRELEKSYT